MNKTFQDHHISYSNNYQQHETWMTELQTNFTNIKTEMKSNHQEAMTSNQTLIASITALSQQMNQMQSNLQQISQHPVYDSSKRPKTTHHTHLQGHTGLITRDPGRMPSPAEFHRTTNTEKVIWVVCQKTPTCVVIAKKHP